MSKEKPITGNEAVSEAMRQINPDVVAAYPITPQSSIMEKFAKFVANGVVDSELITVESEHSAMSATIGAAAAGARAMTATSSVGLALMFEAVNAASGLRLPIVMPIVNRALSAPINIHCDHSDSMACRDAGWIQMYCEDGQEAYENTIMSIRICEDLKVMTPAMVCQDGFITSHGVQNTIIYDDASVRKFVGEHKPLFNLLDVDNPITIGAIELTDYFFETKRQQVEGMENAVKAFPKVAKEFSKITGHVYKHVEKYKTDDAEAIIVTMSSAAGTTKTVVDKLRKKGKKVGLLKIRTFRPFPYKEVGAALSNAKSVATLDRSFSFGAHAPLYGSVLNSVYCSGISAKLQSYVFGIGGRDLFDDDIMKTFNDLLTGKVGEREKYLGLRE